MPDDSRHGDGYLPYVVICTVLYAYISCIVV